MKKVKAPYNKNEIVTVTVTDMGSSGEGIGRTQQGYTLFIKDAVIGDTVTARIMKANKSYGFARLEEVLEAMALPDWKRSLCPLPAGQSLFVLYTENAADARFRPCPMPPSWTINSGKYGRT